MPMTTRQMTDAEAMWAKGVSVKRIAQALGVSETCVRNTAYLHRDRFPRRSANGAPRKLDYELAYRLHARGVTAEVVGIGDDRFFYADDGLRYAWASDKIHHHAPTVEDVLREFAAQVTNGQHIHGAIEIEQAVAECAARLMLAGSDE